MRVLHFVQCAHRSIVSIAIESMPAANGVKTGLAADERLRCRHDRQVRAQRAAVLERRLASHENT